MVCPESIIAPDGAAEETRLLLQATENLNAAVSALQEATSLLEEKTRQLHTHETVMADRDRPGHFSPGAGFTYDPETRCHNIDALNGVQELASELAKTVATETATPVATKVAGELTGRLFAERDAEAASPASFSSPAGSRTAVIAANTNWGVPQYVVGKNTLEVFFDGLPCFAGIQYREIGVKDEKSAVIQWTFNIPVNNDIYVRVTP